MVILLWIIFPFQEVFIMARKSYTTEQIIGLLRQAEVMLSQGKTLDTVIREIGVTRNTYYRWRKDSEFYVFSFAETRTGLGKECD